MKIKSIHIDKFRSIKKCEIYLNEINAIVGENNSGKTSILRALNSFFNYSEEKDYFIDNTHRYSIRANTKIEIAFTNISDLPIYQDKLINNELIVGMRYIYSSNKRSVYYKYEGRDIPVEESFIELIKKDINYIYIPASRSNYDLNWSNYSIFKKLIIEYAKNYTQSRDTISNYVKKATEKLHNSILAKLENQLKDLFPTNEDFEFSIGYDTDVDYNMLLENLILKMKDKEHVFPISEYGSGIKSLTIISVFRALASMYNSNIVLGLEEPETNLHPQMQKQFIMSVKSEKKNKETQLIIATHSPVIIDELQHEDIILIRRQAEEKRGFYSVVSQLPRKFWDQFEDDGFRYYQFFNYRNSDFFFSKYVIITESKTDAQVFEKLLELELGWKMAYISIINLEGVKNIAYPYFLLKTLKLPFSIIVDKDYLTPYLNDDLEKSRDPNSGLPLYKEQIKESKVLLDILPNVSNRKALLFALKSSTYTKVFDYLRPYKIYTMKYCLEIDLLSSPSIREQFYSIFNMPEIQQTQKELLINKKKVIKRIENILSALEGVNTKNYPISLRKIKKALIEDISEYL